MNKSIYSMNRTIGERELDPTGVKLTKLETLAVRLEVAYNLQAQKGWSAIIAKGNDLEASVLADLVDICNSDPAHVLNTKQDYTEFVTVTKYNPDMALHGYAFNSRRFEEENKARKELHDAYNRRFK